MKNHKKGAAMTWESIGYAILVIIVVAIVIFAIRKPAAAAESFSSAEILKAKNQKCKFDSDRAKQAGTTFKDDDKDGYADSCDVCARGANKEDQDLDGLPDKCDAEPNNPAVRKCASGLSLKDGRCV